MQLWSEHHHAKYRIGDLLMLYLLAKDSGSSRESLKELRDKLRNAIAVSRAIADQKNAELRDFPETDDTGPCCI